MKASDLTPQQAKEHAARLAIKNGFSLVRRGPYEIWKVGPDKTDFFCRCDSPHLVWHTAISILERDLESTPRLTPPPLVRFTADIVHNVFIHPLMPFTWGRVRKALVLLHDITGQVAYPK